MSLSAVEILPGCLYYTGTQDPGLRTFDIVMCTEFGSSYNSYILKGRTKTVLFETTKPKLFDVYLKKIESVLGEHGKIDYLVMNHTEPDHSGSMLKLFQKYPDLTLVCTPTALSFAQKVHNFKFPRTINTTQTKSLDIGGMTLKFLITPFLHWPDSMMTYVPEIKTIFTCDVFGAHYSHQTVFNDAVPSQDDYMKAFRYYYDCIFGPYKPWVIKAFQQLDKIEIQTICCAHGPTIRSDARRYMELYREWSTQAPLEKRVVIAYVSAYGYTGEMAAAIVDGVRSQGIPCDAFDLVTEPKSKFLELFERSKGFMLGTPTLVGEALPQIWDLAVTFNRTVHATGDQARIAAVFGTYGWSGEATKFIDYRLSEECKFQMPLPALKINFRPSEAELAQCREYGAKFARAVKGDAINERSPAAAPRTASPPASATPAPAPATPAGAVDRRAAIPGVNGKVRLWKCVVCGEVFQGVYPPEICPACGAGLEMFVVVENAEDAPKTDFAGTVVVLGAGAAAVAAAKAIRASAERANIVMVAEEPSAPQLPYYRPALSDMMTDPACIDRDSFLLQSRKWYDDQRIALRLGERVAAISPADKQVRLASGATIAYDRLVYALGACNCAPPQAEPILRAANGFSLRSLEDAKRIRAAVVEGKAKKAVLLGGGILNLEMANELVALGVHVTVLEVLPRVLPRQLDAAGSRVLQQALEKKGVVVHCACTLDQIVMGAEGRIAALRMLVAGRTEPVMAEGDVFLLSCGVRPATDLAKSAGLTVNRAVVVDRRMATSNPAIFACGDCAECEGAFIPSWSNAQGQGAVAGQAAVGVASAEYKRESTPFFLEGFDIKMVSVGDCGVAQPTERYQTLERNDASAGIFRKLFFIGGRLVGAIAIGPNGPMPVAMAMQTAVTTGASVAAAASLLM